LDLRNSRPTSFCCQLLRCVECAVNGRVHGTGCKHGRVGAAAAFESRTDHVHGSYAVCTRAWTAVYTGHKQVHVHGTRPRTWAVNTAVSIDSTRPFTGRVLYTGRKHGRVQGTGRVYGPCTAVYTVRTPPCTRAVKTAEYTVHGPCTVMYRVRTRSGTGRVPGRVLPRTGCVHGRVPDTDGPCAWPVYGRVHSLYTAEGGRAQSVHGRSRPCTDCVHGRARAMYMVRP